MKIATVFLCLIANIQLSTYKCKNRNQFEAGLLKVIEKCKKGDVRSLPFALPSLKSKKLQPFTYNVGDFTIHVGGLTVDGLEKMSVENLTAWKLLLSMSLKLYIPRIAIRADSYNLRGGVFFDLIQINDAGILTANIANLRAAADVRFARLGGDTVITNLKLSYSVNDIKIYLSDTSFIINYIINSKISSFISDSNFKKKIRNLFIKSANKKLRGHTPARFIHIISRYGCVKVLG